MKINLTKKQYWNLIRATYIADWMANAICEGDMKEDEGIKEIRNYIFSFAKEMGFEKFVDYDDKLKTVYATYDLDDEPSIRKLIERYDEDSAWDEIIEWLGRRDFLKKYTREEIEKMTDEERFAKRIECEDKWGEEFEKNGIERIGIMGK